MSLEQALAENTAAIKAQTALMEKLAGKGGTAAAAAATTTAKPAATKPAGTKAAGKVKEEDLRKTATEFLSVQNPEDRENNKAWVGKINEHFGVTKITEAPQDKWADIVRMLKQLSAGETPPELAEDGGGEEESGDSMI